MYTARTMRLWMLFILSTVLVSCQTKIHEAEPIARINGIKITVRDYLDLFDDIKPQEHSLSGTERAKIKNLVIKTLVRRQIILDAAEKEQIELTEDEVDRALKAYQPDLTSGIFEESLLEGMIDKEEWKRRVTQNLLMERLFASKNFEIAEPSREEALQYYQENSNDFSRKGECTAEHLVVEEASLAKEIHDKITKRPARFRSLAREYSIGPEAKEQARITVEEDIMPEEIDDFLFNSKPREVSDVIRTNYGYHILRKIRCEPAVNFSFDQVKKEIVRRLRNQRKQLRMQQFEENLIRAATIEYNRELIKKL